MEAPVCPMCGKKEWRHVCNPKRVDIRPSPVVRTRPPSKAGRPRLNRTVEEKRRMRAEYMRKRRANVSRGT